MWRHVTCSCGARYRDLRLWPGRRGRALYREIWALLADDSPDPSAWRYKSRGVILGTAHELKRRVWQDLHASCSERSVDP